MNKYEKEIFDLYDKLNIGKSEICKNCKFNNELSKPISIWQVGDNYYNSEHKILFVGKVARGELGTQYNNFLDVTDSANGLYKRSWAYWSYTRTIVEKIYGKDGWEQIAFTNMVKCNNSPTVDKSKKCMKENCLHILKEEIKILKPKVIVFYTGTSYDEQVKSVFESIENMNSEEVDIGKKKMKSLKFNGIIENNKINCIKVNHPQMMKKVDYVNYIVEYIKSL